MTKQELIKKIEEIHNQLDRQRSALEDLDFELRQSFIWNDDMDIDGEIEQAAAEVEAVEGYLEKVIQALKDPATEYHADYHNSWIPDDREIELRNKIIEGLESVL